MPAELFCYALGLRTRFRGITERQGMIWRGPAGWAEWSPFLDYAGGELVPWLRAADEAAERGWPAPLRTEIPVNSTVPAVGPEEAYAIARAAGCRTAKVKVAERGQSLVEDAARIDHSPVDADIPNHAADAANIQLRVAYGVENRQSVVAAGVDVHDDRFHTSISTFPTAPSWTA